MVERSLAIDPAVYFRHPAENGLLKINGSETVAVKLSETINTEEFACRLFCRIFLLTWIIDLLTRGRRQRVGRRHWVRLASAICNDCASLRFRVTGVSMHGVSIRTVSSFFYPILYMMCPFHSFQVTCQGNERTIEPKR